MFSGKYGSFFYLLLWSPVGAAIALCILYCSIINNHISWGKWGPHLFKCSSGVFCDLLFVLLRQSWRNSVPHFLHLEIMALTAIHWSPRALEKAVYSFPDWQISMTLSHICSSICFDCCIMRSFWRLSAYFTLADRCFIVFWQKACLGVAGEIPLSFNFYFSILNFHIIPSTRKNKQTNKASQTWQIENRRYITWRELLFLFNSSVFVCSQ